MTPPAAPAGAWRHPWRWARRAWVPPFWAVAIGSGIGVMAAGGLPPPEAAQMLDRVGPVLGFVVAVTVLAELSDTAGVFDAAADLAARSAGGRTWLLFVLVVGLAAVSTVLLSLDTTAVLLTPVVLAMCARLGLPPLPFAMATVWLANTASLLLPVSNLTNLLAQRALEMSPTQFAAQMAAPATVGVLVTTVVLAGWYHRQLRGRYRIPESRDVPERVLFGVCTAAIASFVVAVLLDADAPVTAGICATVAVVAFVARRHPTLSWALVPWRLVLTITGLFLVIEGAHRHGLGAALAHAAGTGTDLPSLLQLAGSGALSANLVNNLPAYLVLEPNAAGSPERLLALVIGVNVGPLITLWGSLATLLWLDRCRARGLQISPAAFAMAGLTLVPGVLVCAVTALALA